MYIEKYGAHREGLKLQKQTFRQICNRLQAATHYFLDECEAEKYYELAKMYRYLSQKDKRQFDYILQSVEAWLDYMAYDGAGTTKSSVVMVTDEIPEHEIKEI